MKKFIATTALVMMASSVMAEQSLDLSDVYTAAGQSVPSDVQTNIDDFIETADGDVTTNTAQVYTISISSGVLSKETEDFDYTEGEYSTVAEFDTAEDTLVDSVVTDFLGGADRELSVLDDKITVTAGERAIDNVYDMVGASVLGIIGGELEGVIDDLNGVNSAALNIVDEGFTSARWTAFEGAASTFTTSFADYNSLVSEYSDALEAIDAIDHITE